MEKLTLNVKELAETLNIGLNAAYSLVKRPDFYPAFRIGEDSRTWIIDRIALTRWMADQTAHKQVAV